MYQNGMGGEYALGQQPVAQGNGYSLVVDVIECPCGDPYADPCEPCEPVEGWVGPMQPIDPGTFVGPIPNDLVYGPQQPQQAGFPWWLLLVIGAGLASRRKKGK